MKSRLGNNPLKALSTTGKRNEFAGRDMQLTIEKVAIDELIPNPLNARFFKALTEEEMNSLVENIRANGIHDPLIAKRNKTLISGHNRLEAAKILDLTHVPVRYLLDEMTEQEEVRFIISDNLLRRHLSNGEKIDLYRMLFPDFDKRIAVRNGVDSVHTPEVKPLPAKEIAQATGQTKEAVQKQLQRFDAQQKRESQTNRRTQEEVAKTSAANSEEQMRAREREAERIIKSSLEEIAVQINRSDVSPEWKAKIMQRVLAGMEKTQRLLAP